MSTESIYRRIAVATLAVALLSCSPSSNSTAMKVHETVALSDQEDEVCGMLVHEMSAPRGQVVHRDGSRFFFCSLGDMLVHLSAPSPHGCVEATFVEVMRPDEDPMQSHTGVHPWVPANEAVFVIGIDRPGIMGKPVLAYANQSEAAIVMEAHDGTRQLDVAGLQKWWKALDR